MDILLIVMLAVLGALLGSFACAQVWRLRARQLVVDKRDGEPVDRKELATLKPLLKPAMQDRSECLHCHHPLAWYDLIPVASWLTLRGRCRYCRAPIGGAEIAAEIGLAATFVLSYLFWPVPLLSTGAMIAFSLWLVGCVVMTILLIYDMKWALLPFALNIALIVIAVAFRVCMALSTGESALGSLVLGLVLLAGLYLLFSMFGWAGMGDGILGVSLALFVGTWEQAFLVLFLANLLGCLMLIPLMLRKQLHRQARIPFGPFMIIAAVIVMLWGNDIVTAALLLSSNVFNSLML